MVLELLSSAVVFVLVAFSLAWPIASRLALDPAEKLAASVVLSLLGAYLAAGAVYVLHLPAATLWLLPVLAAVGLATGMRALTTLLRDHDVRALLLGQLLVTGWCVGWLATIVSYSGGGWTGDWFEHWERTQFFLEHWPIDTQFLGFEALSARPPLANLVTGALLAPAGATFAGYQLVTALLNSLAFLPAALLARRFSARGTAGTVIAVCAILLMLNPSFLENATFAWTKLIAAFFILSGLYFFLRMQDSAPPAAAAPLCAASLAAGLLAHYSAGPYVVVLAIAWLGLNRARWRDPAGWRQAAQLSLVGGAILATWFAWSLAVYGPHTTFFSNSSVAVPEARQGNQLVKVALNLRDTLIPHFLRTVDPQLIAQRSPWGYARDWCFQVYQVNLLLMFGSVAWLALGRELGRAGRDAPARSRWFWLWFAGGTAVLGVAVHGARDHWGLAHICLQTLLVLGLAVLAARWPALSRGWRRALIAGAFLDFGLGIVLNFGVQSFALDRWFAAGRPPLDLLTSYSGSALMNLQGRLMHHLPFLSDLFPGSGGLVLALLAVILTLALFRAASAARRSD